MKLVCLLTLFSCCISINIYSQENGKVLDGIDNDFRYYPKKKSYVLDGVFIKETTLTKRVTYSNLRPFYNNPSFSSNRKKGRYVFSELINKDDTSSNCESLRKVDYLRIKKISKELKENFVFIDPIEKYGINKSRPSTKHLNPFGEEYYFILTDIETECKKVRQPLIFPNSLRFYIDSSFISIPPNKTLLVLDSNFRITQEQLPQPFYFSKYEVTNKEYREFVDWVKDSIARTILFEEISREYGQMNVKVDGDSILTLNFEKEINWNGEEEKEALDVMLIQNYKRFYFDKRIDTRKLLYASSTVKPILIYPDTLCWVNDFAYSYNEPMTNMYFWHPAYEDYPIVGVSFWQVEAFLDWKTRQHQKKLNKEGSNLKVLYSLPNDFQWDLVSTAELTKDTVQLLTLNYHTFSDASWITNLKLKMDDIKRVDSIAGDGRKFISYRKDELYSFNMNANRFDGNLVVDESFHTSKVNIDDLDKEDRNHPLIACNKDEFGICYMAGNVSEWINNDYTTQWKLIFDLRQQQLNTVEEESIQILSSIERYYDKKNHSDGKLVRGSNWYDERFSNLLGKNLAGIKAKTFISPDSSYSTLGFRYVITFNEK